MIIGLAGHVDHGKSTLVTALTGVPTDRAPEAQRRGITIDLQAVALRDANGRPFAALIDVPGHEDFVRAMVAGCSGVGAILLVVAADDGIMPQTREHLLVAEVLGVPRGIAVITKSDLVEPEWLELVRSDVAELTSGSSVVFTPLRVVAAGDGVGRDALLDELRTLARQDDARHDDDLFRLPVDRIFHRAGIGTIVTGTAWSGAVTVGDQLELLPTTRRARVRSIEVHGEPVHSARAGQRVALGLAGLAHDAVRRGDVVVHAGNGWFETSAIDAIVSLAPDAPHALVSGTRVVVHAGTAAVLARIVTRRPIAAGGSGPVRLALDRSMVVRGGDRLVLRRPSPAATIGGAVVLDPAPPRRAAIPIELTAAGRAARTAALATRRHHGLRADRAAVVLGVAPADVSALAAEARLRLVAGRWLSDAHWRRLTRSALAALHRHYTEDPAAGGLSLETLRQRIAPGGPARLADAVIGDLMARGELLVDGDRVALPGLAPRPAPGSEVVERVVAALTAHGLAAPPASELAAELGEPDTVEACRVAERAGRLVALERGRWVAARALEAFGDLLRELAAGAAANGSAETGTPGVTVAGVRERTGLSRKFLIPALEWADRAGLTRRDGDRRTVVARSP
jgi:selenocysteine-specific elongation factor